MSKNIYRIFALQLALFSVVSFMSSYSFAQNTGRFWTGISEGDFIAKGERRITPQEYKTTVLDLQAMAQALKNAPMERTERAVTNPLVIELPVPDGSMALFQVERYSMMEEGLAKQFPDIVTATVKGNKRSLCSGQD